MLVQQNDPHSPIYINLPCFWVVSKKLWVVYAIALLLFSSKTVSESQLGPRNPRARVETTSGAGAALGQRCFFVAGKFVNDNLI